MTIGPDQIDHAHRMQIAEEIAGKLRDHFRERVVAISIYGSLAKGTDGPYSDIEMDCVLDGLDRDLAIEWCGGGWKAEIDLFSVGSILKKAAEVGPKWSISHGIYIHYIPIYDPTNLYIHRRKTALSQPETRFRRAMRDLIVEEMYGNQGKILNTAYRKDFTPLPLYAVLQARWGALLIGLANRYLYSTSARIFPESLELDGRPDGFDDLCRLVMSGTLSDPAQLLAACVCFWQGVEKWAQEKGIRLVEDLQDLLNRDGLIKSL